MRDGLPKSAQRMSLAGEHALVAKVASRAGCALLATFSALVQAQTAGARPAGGQREFIVQPRASIAQTFTDNVDRSAAPVSDSITQLTAGLSFESNSARLRGYLDYGLSGLLYAQHGEKDTYQNALRAALGVDLIDNRARLDATASISQTALSAFGVQPNGSGLPGNNTTELRTLAVTPSFRGPLGPIVKYTALFGYTVSNAGNTVRGDSRAYNASVRFEPVSAGPLGWSIEASQMRSDFQAGRATESDRLIGTVKRKIHDLDLELSANGGIEMTDLASQQRQRYKNWGVGATWVPSERTRLAAQLDHRFFGRAHSLSLDYRTALTSWSISDSRNVSTSSNGSNGAGRGTVFDLYFAQFASIEPDPVKRTALVNSFLSSNGINPTTGVDTGFLRSGATVVRGQNAAVAYRSMRSAAVLVFTRSETERVAIAALSSDDLRDAAKIQMQSVTLNLSHRLTPTSSVNLGLSDQKTRGELTRQSTGQRQANLQYTTRLTSDGDLSVMARRTLYSKDLVHFDENTLVATYSHRF